jgi:uncharacterized membrane-anchored protein
MKRIILGVILSLFFGLAKAQVDTLFNSFPDSTRAQFDSLTYQTGKVMINDGMAELNVPKGFKYLDGKQSEYVISSLWGNPPSSSLGMLFPAYANQYYPSTWAITFTYSDEGHIKDDDAKDIKYDELLKNMQDETNENNKLRIKEGYPSIALLGWASAPFYDAKSKKLHWAKRLKFDSEETETLNYNIRILGRKGVLVLNAIGDMSDLSKIKTEINPILASIEFTKGNRYEDFDESIDKLAAYGIGGLITGGILAKTGLFAKIGLIIAKFAKVIFIGIAGAGGAIYKWFTSKKKEDEPEVRNLD